MSYYKITYCIVDFPMGVSPEYTESYKGENTINLTLEEANRIFKKLNKRKKKSSTYAVYFVREM